jgi:predicted ATPase
MLTRLRLQNFKCFQNLDLPLTALTLLCGLNGMGKSSVIQSLLVLRQSYAANELLNGRLVLSGDSADIGTGSDILFEDANEDSIEFELQAEDVDRPWSLRFDYDRTADLLMAQAKRPHRPPSYVPLEWREHQPFGGQLIYVSAERIGPRKFHSRSETMARRGEIGARGEYAVNFLNERIGDQLPPGDPRIRDAARSRLLDVVDDWLQELTPGAHLELESVPAIDSVIAGFSFDRSGDVASRRFRATNVGFGLSFVLPVLVALLAPTGAFALIENPEAHLHPRAQTKLGELAALATRVGVQVIVETHSDHFMDGVRIAVREGIASSTDIAFHYFVRRGSRSEIVSPIVDSDGRLSSWPEGFFDQRDDNLARLIAPRQANA